MKISFSGFAQSGKDTAVKVLSEEFGFERVSFADPLRLGLYRLNTLIPTVENIHILNKDFIQCLRLQEIVDDIGWDAAKTKYTEVRELLQRFGTECVRETFWDSFWIDLADRQVKNSSNDKFAFSDTRFPNEVKYCRNDGILVKIKNPRVQSVNTHVSDNELPDDMFDYIIHNDEDIESFRTQVRELIVKIQEIHEKSTTQAVE